MLSEDVGSKDYLLNVHKTRLKVNPNDILARLEANPALSTQDLRA